jgi:hypothetical protein
MLRTRQVRLSAAFLREFVDTITAGGLLATESGRELARLAADVLENALPGLSKDEASAVEERFLRAVEGRTAADRSASGEAAKKQTGKRGKR